MNLDKDLQEKIKDLSKQNYERNKLVFNITLLVEQLVKEHHNDADLGREIRKLVNGD
jgi:hypothetical protein